MDRIPIYIPSYKRHFAEDLPGKDYFTHAKYVVPESQAEAYAAIVGHKRVIAIPDELDGNLTRKKNWILKNLDRPHISIDDDVKCMAYWDNRKEHYLSRTIPKELVDEVFLQCQQLAIDFGAKMWGVAQNDDDRVYKEFKPFSLKNLILGPFQGHLDHDLLYDEQFIVKQDYDMSLQQLQKYGKLLRVDKFAYVAKHGTNKGGVVSYRTVELETETAKRLMKKWGTKVIKYNIPPKKKTDLLNAAWVKPPIKGV